MEQELELRLRAKTPILWLATPEEDRCVPRTRAVAEKLGYAAFLWNCLHGFAQLSEGNFRQPGDSHCTNVDQALQAAGAYTQQRALFIMHDVALLARRLEAQGQADYVVLVRRLKELYGALRQADNAVVFLAPSAVVPAEIEDCVALVETLLPDPKERVGIISTWIARNCRNLPCTLDEEGIHGLASAAAAMTSRQIQNALAFSVVRRRGLTAEAIDDMIGEKVAAVKKSEVLEYVHVTETLDDVGGLEGIKDYLRKRSSAFGRAAAVYGLPAPKGILIVGVPGTGKSLIEKVTASVLRVLLLRLDMGRIHGSLLGQSEDRMRRALAMAASQAPVVVGLEELEKAFAGARGSAADGGTTQRVLGHVLTWMQERKEPIYIAATANDIRQLPPEFTRPGRFDTVFFVDLPTASERKAILHVLLRRRGLRGTGLVTDALVRRTDRYTGAELEVLVAEAMVEAFSDKQRPVCVRDLEAATARVIPLADQRADEIEALRRWGKANARPAS